LEGTFQAVRPPALNGLSLRGLYRFVPPCAAFCCFVSGNFLRNAVFTPFADSARCAMLRADRWLAFEGPGIPGGCFACIPYQNEIQIPALLGNGICRTPPAG